MPRGFRAAGTTCGIKPSGRPDLTLIISDSPCSAAGVFTTNRCLGAPVVIGKRHLRRGLARAIVCNSGIANVATGAIGLRHALAMCEYVARRVDCAVSDVLPCSTGLIGPRLPIDRIGRGIGAAVKKLARGAEADAEAASAILTTDLVSKQSLHHLRLGPKTGTITRLGGIAKGSGMIAPNMATMLCFITTDAAIVPAALRAAVKEAVKCTFNRISVDNDTSTSDAVLVLANGAAGGTPITGPGRKHNIFVAALINLCEDLALQIVRDGEGAKKVMRVHVERAATQRDADRVGRAIVNSPLVKTALHGGDPNWGRLIMAVGKSGARVVPQRLSVTIADVTIFARGAPVALRSTTLRKLTRGMRRNQVVFQVDLGLADAHAKWLGCDLSKQYVTINAEYTT